MRTMNVFTYFVAFVQSACGVNPTLICTLTFQIKTLIYKYIMTVNVTLRENYSEH